MLLDIIGYEVQTAPDGPAALAAAHPFKAQAGLLDIGRAWYGQLLISQELASSARRHALTFLIALIGSGDMVTHERVKHVGFDQHMLIPCDSDVLENLLTVTRKET